MMAECRMDAKKLATCISMSLGGSKAAAMIEMIPSISVMIQHCDLVFPPEDATILEQNHIAIKGSLPVSTVHPDQDGVIDATVHAAHITSDQMFDKVVILLLPGLLIEAECCSIDGDVAQVDANHDGVIDRSEFKQALQGGSLHAKGLGAQTPIR